MSRVFWTFSAVVVAAGLMCSSADALSLGLGTGKGGLINTGGGNGGLINVNTGGGDSGGSGGSSGVGGTVGGLLSGGSTENSVGGLVVGTNGPSPTGTSATISGPGLNGLGGLTGGVSGLLNSLFGSVNGILPGVGGGANGGGGDGSGGSAGTGFGGGGMSVSYDPATKTACFMPNSKQLATLLNRHDYAGNWAQGVTSLKVVKVPICAAALAKIAAAAATSPNVLHLQDSLGTSSWTTDQLARQGYTGSAVVAADRNGGSMVLYVI